VSWVAHIMVLGADGRLGLLDATPQSPTPGLSRTQSTTGVSTPDRPSTIKATPFPTSFISPSKPETSAISAIGEHDWLMDGKDQDSRARRELSVIDSVADDEERDARSASVREGLVAADAAEIYGHSGDEETQEDDNARPVLSEPTTSDNVPQTPDLVDANNKSASAGTAALGTTSQTTATTPDAVDTDQAKGH